MGLQYMIDKANENLDEKTTKNFLEWVDEQASIHEVYRWEILDVLREKATYDTFKYISNV